METKSEIEEFLTFLLTEKGDGKKTLEAYSNDLNQFCQFVENKDVSQLSAKDYQDFLFYLKDKNLKNTSVIRKSMAVKGFYKFLKKEKLNNTILFDLNSPKKEKHLPVYLSLEEVQSLLDCIDVTKETGLLDKTMLLLCFSCGLRVSELIDIQIDRIDIPNGVLKVTGKGNKQRLVPFSNEVAKELLAYKKEYRDKIKTEKKNFFIHQNGTILSRQYVFLKVKEYAKKASISKDVSPHTLRHSFATLLLSQGANLKEVQTLLGHEEIQTTEIYTHLEDKKREEIYFSSMPRKKSIIKE